MTRVTITDPTEAPHSGYYSIEIEERGELLADINLAPELVPDLNDPDDLAEVGEVFKQVAGMAEEMDHA